MTPDFIENEAPDPQARRAVKRAVEAPKIKQRAN
jgi:hypothetical protein